MEEITSPVAEIAVGELAQRRRDGDVRLIDVREPDEYEEAHVPGARLVPLSTVPDSLDQIGTDPVVVICKSGGRSMKACEFLLSRGVMATNVAGGTMAWVDSGLEVATGSEPG